VPFASRDDGTEVKAITRGPSVLRGSKRNLAAVLGNFGTTEGIVLREHVGEGEPDDRLREQSASALVQLRHDLTSVE
jgi:hypothetical protein